MPMTEKHMNNCGDFDLDQMEEIALAMAQAEIEDAVNCSGLKYSQVAEKAGRPRSFISKILRGNHNLTIRTMARNDAACGYELRFGRQPVLAAWVSSGTSTSVPASASSPMGDAPVFAIQVAHAGASLMGYGMAT
jgi:hypothetical protein